MDLILIAVFTTSIFALIIYSVTWMPVRPSKYDNLIGFIVLVALVLMVIHMLYTFTCGVTPLERIY